MLTISSGQLLIITDPEINIYKLANWFRERLLQTVSLFSQYQAHRKFFVSSIKSIGTLLPKTLTCKAKINSQLYKTLDISFKSDAVPGGTTNRQRLFFQLYTKNIN